MLKKNNQIILGIITRTLKIKNNNLKLNTALGSIPEWDSLAHLKIFSKLNKKFKNIDLNKASEVRTIKDWINLVNEN